MKLKYTAFLAVISAVLISCSSCGLESLIPESSDSESESEQESYVTTMINGKPAIIGGVMEEEHTLASPVPDYSDVDNPYNGKYENGVYSCDLFSVSMNDPRWINVSPDGNCGCDFVIQHEGSLTMFKAAFKILSVDDAALYHMTLDGYAEFAREELISSGQYTVVSEVSPSAVGNTDGYLTTFKYDAGEGQLAVVRQYLVHVNDKLSIISYSYLEAMEDEFLAEFENINSTLKFNGV